MEDTCMLATQLRRRYEEVRSRAVAETLHTDLDQDTEEEVTLTLDIRPSEHWDKCHFRYRPCRHSRYQRR